MKRSVWLSIYIGSIYVAIGTGVGLDQVVMQTGSGVDPVLRFLYSVILWPIFLFWTWYHHPGRG
jgi:hypothetical protein